MAPLRLWAINLPGSEAFEVRDLHVDVLDALGAPYGLSWADVINDPAARAGLLARVVATVAEIVGSTLPPIVSGRDAMAALESLVVLAEENEDPEE